MTDRIQIEPCGPIHATIRPPGSKSITNRALICAALADGDSSLKGVLDSDDTRVMIEALQKIGYAVSFDTHTSSVQISGCSTIPADSADLFVGNSGTTIRFLTAMLATSHGRFRLDGVERMRQRPIADLLDALKQLGADVSSEADPGYPPVRVNGRGLRGGQASVAGNISSQFLSGLLMACPNAASDVELIVRGQLVSRPYVSMTMRVMEHFGVRVDSEDLQRFHVSSDQQYQGRRFMIEPDASAASYFWAAAAITGGRATVIGLTPASLQGDVAFCKCLEEMGCQVEVGPDEMTVVGQELHGIDVDMNGISDTVQTLAAVALFAEGPTTITGIEHIRYKETDRISDLARELEKLGAKVDQWREGMRITPNRLSPSEVLTYSDHRMAMSLALVGLRVPGVVILDPGCTEKTYPGFFQDLQSITT